jgi:hypothetical protein
MSRKHNTKHARSRSHYKDRLAARGLGRTPRMTHYGDLHQGRRDDRQEARR